jgi:hypothetical protein
VTDVEASAQQFLSQLRENSEILKERVTTARRERDEAQARLADAEAKLGHSMGAVRALLAYTGGSPEPGEDDPAKSADPDTVSLEGAILRVLRESSGGTLTPSEIAQELEALGVTRSAASVRARLSKLVKQGVLERDAASRYSICAAGTETPPG